MADTKISALTSNSPAELTNEIPINDAGTTKKISVSDLATLISPTASDTVAGLIEIATQAEQETGTDTARAVVPGRQHYHPSAAKFWVKATGNSTTIEASYNMASWANTGTGDADGTITTDFSSATWCGVVTTLESGTDGWDADSIQSSGFNAQAAGTFGVLCGFIIDGGTAVAALTHPVSWHVVGFGDL